MKKQHYTAPVTRSITLCTEGMIATSQDSLDINRNADAEAQQLTNRYGWDSSNWTDNEEE